MEHYPISYLLLKKQNVAIALGAQTVFTPNGSLPEMFISIWVQGHS